MHTNKQLLTLLVTAGLLIVGCVTFAKKQIQQESTAQKAETTVQNNPNTATFKDGCPKIVKSDRNGQTNPYYFAYEFDLKDAQCAANNISDLFGTGKLFPFAKYDSLAIDENRNGYKNIVYYKQYYKGIEIGNEGFLISYNNGKIARTVGTFYPNLDIDTTGMISRETALKQAFKSADAYEGDWVKKYWEKDLISNATPIIIGNAKKIIYVFDFGKAITPRDGVYKIDAKTGELWRYSPAEIGNQITDCYKCAATGMVSLQCEDTCSTSLCSVYANNKAVTIPTLYNSCQTIYADSCSSNGKIIYRMAPTTIVSGDSINVYDGTTTSFNGFYNEIRWCYTDSTLSKKNTIASSLHYAIATSKAYFNHKNIEVNNPVKVLAHIQELVDPSPTYAPYNGAAWVQSKQRFEFGDGDNVNVLPPVSVDIIAHEYGHRILYNKFDIGSHVTNDTVAHKYEASAIHEGISDIFSTLVRRHAYGSIDWKIGNQVVIGTSNNLPRDLSHPENTNPPQALYYNDPAAYWNDTASRIYNHAGIIAKWFYLMTNGGTGFKFATDNITVQPIGIDTAEMVLISGLHRLDTLLQIRVPSYEQFCQAMVDAAQSISCNARLQTLRAWKAVGVGLSIPGGRTDQSQQDETLCFVDLRMRDNDWDNGQEPNYSAGIDADGGGWSATSPNDWEDIWNSPDLWNCDENENCPPEEQHNPRATVVNKVGFSIYNAHPNLVSDPATLHLYYAMASTGEVWNEDWIDNQYQTFDLDWCYVGDELLNSPVNIPAIAPQNYYTNWVTWSPPNFVNSDYPFYVSPDDCGLSPETDPTDGELKYEICLLARLMSEQDPIVAENDNTAVGHNVLNSNNIVTRNAFLIDPALGPGGGLPPIVVGHPSVVLVTNNNNDPKYLDILFDKYSQGNTEALSSLMEISFVLSPELWSKWESTGKMGEGVQIIGEREVKITNMETAKLLNIPFDPKEFQPLAIKVTILSTSGKREIATILPDSFGFRVTHSSHQPINRPSNCLFMIKDIKQQSQIAQMSIEQLQCVPNPFSDAFDVSFYLTSNEKAVSLSLYDMHGKLVKTLASAQHFSEGRHTITVNSNYLATGLYICTLTTHTGSVSQKIVKF